MLIKSRCEEASKCYGIYDDDYGLSLIFFLHSHCAGLVIDGGIAYPFNDGAKILLEVNPEDTLLTITLNETLEP